MFQIKFIEASNLVGKERPTRNLQSSACRSALNSYRANIWRHMALIGLPGYASLTAFHWATANFTAQQEMQCLQPSPELVARANQIMDQLMAGDPAHKQQLLTLQTKNCETFIGRTTGSYEHVLETVLKSVLILAWSTLETLVEDLHTNVLSENPRLFGHVQNKKFYFRRRDAFRESYKLAFQSDAVIDRLLAKPALDAVALIRNLLVHKSGIVDSEFRKHGPMVPLLLPFQDIAEGQPIQISGTDVLLMLDPALEAGFALIERVDEWLLERLIP